MAGTAELTIYCNDNVDLQSDPTLDRVSRELEGVPTRVHLVRRAMPTTLVTITWRPTLAA
jgi:hypothetical protein